MGEGVEDVVKENTKEEGVEEVEEVMDTPERSKNTQIATSISKFEDSPVFNFLNSLSPIKPVKSIHISQTINPLSFASLPSVFTSPHVTSLKESRFLRRHQLSDPSKPEFSSDDRTTSNTNKVANMTLDDKQENVKNPREPDSEMAVDQSYDCSKFVVDFPEDSDCNSPDPTLRPNCGLKGKELVDYATNSSAIVPFVQEASQSNQNKEATSCDWDNLICEGSDLLIFESPDVPNMHTLCVVGPNEGCDQESLSTQPGEGIEMMENAQNHDNPSEKVDYENLPGFYRGMRRRCLVFEMGGARRKHLDENVGSDSSSSSPLLMQSDGNNLSTNDQKLVPIIKTRNESSRRILPGIGLHLNALAATPKDYKIVTHDSSASGRLLIGPSSSLNFHSSNTNQEMLNNILPEKEIDRVEDAVLPTEDACQASGFMANQEIGQSSPKKKRRKADQPGEAEACKRCNCKKSKCLKLYCECFAAGVYCVEPCACIDCFNKPIHEDTVLATRKQIESRNPLAFAPKVIRGADPITEIGDDDSKTPASARHKRGCNCKKSGCLKKYCECYQGGVGCSINCRCEGCKNAFGRKDGTEAEVEEDETDATGKSLLEQNIDSATPATPLRPTRQSAQLPFSSKKKPPRSSFPSIGSSSSGFYSSQGGLGKSNFFQAPPPPKFDKRFETVREENEEMPEFLQGESSPIGGIKLSSPNRKRVSPPHHSVGMSPGLRSSRKLILQSIPSFPSLTSNQ